MAAATTLSSPRAGVLASRATRKPHITFVFNCLFGGKKGGNAWFLPSHQPSKWCPGAPAWSAGRWLRSRLVEPGHSRLRPVEESGRVRSAVLPKDEFSRARPGKLEGKLELGCGDVVFHEPILFVTSSLQALVVGMIFSRFFPRQMSDLRQNQNLAVPNAKRRRDATHLEEPTGRLRRTLFHVPSLCRALLLGDLDSSSSRLLDDDDDAVLSVHGP